MMTKMQSELFDAMVKKLSAPVLHRNPIRAALQNFNFLQRDHFL